MKWNNVFCLICTFLCATPLIERIYAADDVFKKADALFASENYFEATIEYERVLFFSGSSEIRAMANLQKAQALKQLGAFGKARNDLQRSFHFRGDDSLRFEILYQYAFCSYMDNRSDEAFATLLQLKHAFGHFPLHRYFLLQAMVLADLQQWDDLRTHLELWITKYLDDGIFLQNKLVKYDEILSGYEKVFRMDAERARLRSTFVPGLGQIYAGEFGWGLLNGFSQLASLAAFGVMAYNGYYIASFFAGLGPWQSFYFGGIRHAGELAATNKNNRLEDLQTALSVFLLAVDAYLADN